VGSLALGVHIVMLNLLVLSQVEWDSVSRTDWNDRSSKQTAFTLIRLTIVRGALAGKKWCPVPDFNPHPNPLPPREREQTDTSAGRLKWV